MVACCPLSGDPDDGPSCHTQSFPTARKEHRCGECSETIAPGSRYERVTGVWDGRPDTLKTCLSCVEIRDHFACGNGFTYGQLWEDIEANMFPDMVAGGPCLERLSPAAKARLFAARVEWVFESGEAANGAPPPWHPASRKPWREPAAVQADARARGEVIAEFDPPEWRTT
jgi:hypothetical protein